MSILTLIIGAAIFATALWGSLAILDRGNSRNNIGTAAVLGLVFSIPSALGFGLLSGIIPLIALLLVLVQYYDIGLIRSLLVVLLMAVLSYVMAILVAPLLLVIA
jgi:hypothetical protein